MKQPVESFSASLLAAARQRNLGASNERQRIAASINNLHDLRLGFWLHLFLLAGVLAVAFAAGSLFANVKRAAYELAMAQQTRVLADQKLAEADALLQKIEAVQRKQTTPPMHYNRMTPNAGQVSSL